jgi:hypothetical protein
MIGSIQSDLWFAGTQRPLHGGIRANSPLNEAQSTDLKDQTIIDDFETFVSQNLDDDIETIFAEFCVSRQLDEQQITEIASWTYYHLMEAFAAYYLSRGHPTELNESFGEFCSIMSLDEDTAETLQRYIAQNVDGDDNDDWWEYDYDEDKDDENDNGVIDDDRDLRLRVYLFLRRLLTHKASSSPTNPLFKFDFTGKKDIYGNDWGEKVKPFDREANRYGHDINEKFNWVWRMPSVQSHPLHSVAIKHGYKYSHSTPVVQRDGTVEPHHTWRSAGDHEVAAYHGSESWESKVNGRRHAGTGAVALDKHLSRHLPEDKTTRGANPLKESLETPATSDKMNRYVADLNRLASLWSSQKANESSVDAFKAALENSGELDVGDSIVHRNHAITRTVSGFHISKDGSHIATLESLPKAKAAIDDIVAAEQGKTKNEEAPTNSMGLSSTIHGTGSVDSYDPLLARKRNRKILKRIYGNKK